MCKNGYNLHSSYIFSPFILTVQLSIAISVMRFTSTTAYHII